MLSTLATRCATRTSLTQVSKPVWGQYRSYVKSGRSRHHESAALTCFDRLDQLEEPEDGKKEKIVVLGSGWASAAFLATVNPYKYDVTVISPENHFTYTPSLLNVAVGALSEDCISTPIRKLTSRFNTGSLMNFFQAAATNINVKDKKVTCSTQDEHGAKIQLDVEYDHLIIAVGGVPNKTGVTGSLEDVSYLNSAQDAVKLKQKLQQNIELAGLPDVSEERKKKLLNFVVVGGGPVATGIAAHIYDYLESAQDSATHLEGSWKVTVIGNEDHIHNFYDRCITAEYQEDNIRDGLDVMDGRVTQVKNGVVQIHADGADSKQESSCVVWASNGALHPLTDKLRVDLGQENLQRLVTNPQMQVLGADSVYAVGDCATVDQGKLMSKWLEVFEKADTNKDKHIDLEEFEALITELSRQYPALNEFLPAKEIFQSVDVDGDMRLTQEEFQVAMRKLERQMTRFPSTAEVAKQQGEFLALYFNKSKQEAPEKDRPVFKYKHLGGYEYVGAEDGFVERGSQSESIVTGWGARWLYRVATFAPWIPFSTRVEATSATTWAKLKSYF